MSRTARIAALLTMAVLGAGVLASRARADGDPGSDVLVSQSLFFYPDAGISVGEQTELGSLLRSADHAGFPIRVAIIATRNDLGSITGIWGDPQGYAKFLGIEIQYSYSGRLLVVMPSGFGFNWPGHPSAVLAAERRLAPLKLDAGEGFAALTSTAVRRLAETSGVTLAGIPAPSPSARPAPAAHAPARPPQSASPPEPVVIATSHGNSAPVILAIMATLVAGVLAIYYGLRRSRMLLIRRSRPQVAAGVTTRRRLAVRAIPVAALIVGVAAIGYLAEGFPSSNSSTASGLATNPYLDPGTALSGRPAPDFTLYDQFGHPMSLHQYRGKVVILAFNDSECTTVCPLTTTAMLDAKRLLGAAGSQVQLLGVDANPRDIQIQDVLSYSQLHGLTDVWRFGTGTLAQLEHVWSEYGLKPVIQGGLISHTPALYVIDTRGRERKLYLTQLSYTAVGQLGQLLAQEASSLLPGHPRVDGDISYAQARTIPPTVDAQIPGSPHGTVLIGPGKPRLYVFFDTWDEEVMSIGGQLENLNAYARLARGDRLPRLTAIDEGSVEPSPSALPRFLASLHRPLSYPVGIDTTGRIADGYEVQGEPYIVLTSAAGKLLWYYQPDTTGVWLTESQLIAQVRGALEQGPAPPATAAAAQRELSGSPPALAALHRQASDVLGGVPALAARIRALRGYPIVVNLWASWCTACQAEFNLFAAASAEYGRSVAFLGGDYTDTLGAAAAFLHQHGVSYPSYQAGYGQLDELLPGGVQGLPTTIYISSTGRILGVHLGNYQSQGALDNDIQSYALRH